MVGYKIEELQYIRNYGLADGTERIVDMRKKAIIPGKYYFVEYNDGDIVMYPADAALFHVSEGGGMPVGQVDKIVISL
jgi:hypothetical protein